MTTGYLQSSQSKRQEQSEYQAKQFQIWDIHCEP